MWNIIPSLYNSETLTRILRSSGDFSVQKDIPTGMRLVRDSFWASSGDSHFLWVLFGLTLFVIAVFSLWHEVKKNQRRKKQTANNPDRLFEQLLESTGLTPDEKKLLNEMTSGIRLKHPAMCLLSPGMLDWSRQLWLKEKGRRIVTAGKIAQIDEIAVKLYDHRPSSTPEAESSLKVDSCL
ncbi:MAG: hypothetical protein K9M57_04740 [Phycisphaerae bacterium]|nr:hypothetical protein [Phycisphaerae bacterium]